MFRISEVVKHIIIINVVVFIGAITIGYQGDVFRNLFAMHFPLNDTFKPWQIITHMFMHSTYVSTPDGIVLFFEHIFFNMFILLMIGPLVEYAVGKRKFLFLYITAGLGSVVLSFLVEYFQFINALNVLISEGFVKDEVLNTLNSGKYNTGWEAVLSDNQFKNLMVNFNRYSVGASGAIMGVLALLGLMFPEEKFQLIFPPISIKIKYIAVGLIGSDFIAAFLTGTPLLGNSNTGYVAHIGGALTGALIYWYWEKNSV